jgi:arabinose-5-phosphate isomerase
VYLISHACAQRPVNELVTCEATLAGEIRRNDACGEMGVVIGLDADVGAGQAGADQLCDLFRVHSGAVYRVEVDFVGGLSGHAAYNPRAMQSPVSISTTSSPTAAPTDDTHLLASGHRALAIEAQAIAGLAPRLDARFASACRICLACQGRVVVTGMGKSGHIARKIAATFASTGTPAFFLHPAEAGHGDLGMITRTDVVIAISNSGETPELVLLLPHLKRLAVPLIVLVGKVDSTLGRASEVALDVSVAEEACPLNLAPTASTTATLAMGDALAVTVLEARGFTEQDFALSHPGGSLGRQLLLHVEDIMRKDQALPRIAADAPLGAGLIEMSSKGLGMTVVVDSNDQILGVFTDGDLRRAFDKQIDVHNTPMRDVMTLNCKTIGPRALAAEAVHIMEVHRITALPVADAQGRLIGALNVHDLFRAGVV